MVTTTHLHFLQPASFVLYTAVAPGLHLQSRKGGQAVVVLDVVVSVPVVVVTPSVGVAVVSRVVAVELVEVSVVTLAVVVELVDVSVVASLVVKVDVSGDVAARVVDEGGNVEAMTHVHVRQCSSLMP